ncbi:DoxX family protein [Vulcanococcus sp. Clear-D1]|uniref:DoxX family protein n=1 Tax=Vulcanococcus sp. Clear-D1 TaxID=2766970 RepID=UPI0019876D02|nr:DoxX family protein [Vulcanococcus sp. Clear-D1]MBD1194559.1 DoxX family protein [Vulcanococcus sp. Clear-D1]
MPLSNPVEWVTAFLAATIALWFLGRSVPWAALDTADQQASPLATAALGYLQRPGVLASTGLLLLRLSIGLLMIHHGQEKLADPQQFASTYVASLHLPFPLFFAYAAGFSELIGSWLVILGFFTPLGALALTSTMAVAAYQHILTGGFNIYVLELVLLYLGGSLAILLNGPGRFSFDAGMAPFLLSGSGSFESAGTSRLQPSAVPIESR